MPLKKTFAGKLCLLFAVIILPLVLTIGFYYNQKTETLLRQGNQSLFANNLNSIANSFNVYFEKYESIANAALASDSLKALAQDDTTDSAHALIRDREFAAEISRLTVNTFDLNCVYFFTANGQALFTKSNLNLAAVRRKADALIQLAQTDKYSQMRFDGFFPQEGDSSYHILLMRSLYDYKTREYLGVIVLEFMPNIFQKLLSYCRQYTFVTDANGVIVFDTQGRYVGQSAQALWQSLGADARTGVTLDGENGFLSETTTNSGFTIVQFVSDFELNSSIQSLQKEFISFSVFCILLFALVAIGLATRLLRPLKKLESAMHYVENGDFSHPVVINTNDEFARLGDNYNHMLLELNQYIDRAYGERLRRLDAEYRALQAQINPHFLYNALESINSLAQINRQEQISQMVQALARLFRYATVQHGNFVTLQDELAQVRSYVLLQNIGYDGQVQYDERMPEALLPLKMPKLILQPLIENCYNHGFDAMQESFDIVLSAVDTERGLEITVSDNGSGMDEETLSRLRSELAQPLDLNRPSTSIGLCNIHHRLKYAAGGGSGIVCLESAPGQGTRITLLIEQDAQQEEHHVPHFDR